MNYFLITALLMHSPTRISPFV
ncbi:hypothetical protein F383_06232 [Gossypium arboreum]|uniref:Uncharacterized protein n=1 Tax=Gossypium arboreum TaxID=29729 RepID=A0A0B0MMM1_GOSAR|nr:hypothetical protein F383_06232 [Gossypium arboreum]